MKYELAENGTIKQGVTDNYIYVLCRPMSYQQIDAHVANAQQRFRYVTFKARVVSHNDSIDFVDNKTFATTPIAYAVELSVADAVHAENLRAFFSLGGYFQRHISDSEWCDFCNANDYNDNAWYY